MDNQFDIKPIAQWPKNIWIMIAVAVIIAAATGGIYWWRKSAPDLTNNVIKEEPSFCLMETLNKKFDIVKDLEKDDLLKEIFPSGYPNSVRNFSEVFSMNEGQYFMTTNSTSHTDQTDNAVWNGEYWMIENITGGYRYDGENLESVANEEKFREFFWNGSYWLTNNGFKYDGNKLSRVDVVANAIKDFISADYNGDYWMLGAEGGGLYRYNDKENMIIDLSNQFENDLKLPINFIVSLGKNWLISSFYCGSSGCFGVYRYDGEKLEKLYSSNRNIWIAPFGDDKMLVTDKRSILYFFSDCGIVDLHKSFEGQYADMVSCSDEYCLILTRSENEKDAYKNLYKFDGKELKLLNGLFEQKDIDKFSYIYTGDNNWLVEMGSKTYAYQGDKLVDITVNLGINFVDNAVWNGEYWLVTVGDKKILKYIPGFSGAGIKEGSLVKEDNGNIFLIENGKKRQILNEHVFNERGYKWSDVIIASNSELNAYPDGNAVIFKDGSVLRYGSSIYIIENGKKRLILGDKVFNYLNLRLEQTLNVSFDELSLIPDGMPYSKYQISDGAICSKQPYNQNDFSKYLWINLFLNSLKPSNYIISDVCYHPVRNELIYFKKGTIKEDNKLMDIFYLMSFNTLTLQTTQLLELEANSFSYCQLTGWNDNKLEYSCDKNYYLYNYLFDINTKTNTFVNINIMQ